MSSVSPERAETMPREAGLARRLPGGEGLGQRAALVRLDQHGVGGAAQAAAARTRGGIGDQEVVADHLDAVADRAR